MSLRLPLKLFAALVALALLALVAVAFIGISIDAQRWRAPIAAALSRTLGREVQIAGPGRLRLSLRPNLLVEGIRIANPPGFDTPEFASIGELRLSMDLWPLLRGEIRIHELRGRDVSVQLTRSNDGRNNWSFDLRVNDTAAERGKPLRLDVHRVALESVLIEYITGGATHRFNLTELTGEARAGQSTRLALRGVLDEQLTYTANATSAPLSSLGAAQPWPFDLEASFLSTVLKASGTLSGSLESPAVTAAFSASTKDTREIERLLQVKLPPVGAASLTGGLDVAPGTMGLKSIKALVGATAVSGDLALHRSGPRPKLTGQLAISELDLRPFLARAPGDEVQETQTLVEAYRELEKITFDFKPLALLDTDVLLRVARYTGVPGNVRDLSARLRIDAGKLTAPLEATIADARFEGVVSVDSTATPPRIGTNLVTREASLGGLAELLFDAPYVDGTVRRFEVTLDAAGDGVWPLARDLEGQIKFEGARFTYGNFEGGKPVEMRLDAAEVTQPRGKTIAAKVHGALRGKAFDGTFRASTVEQILRERHTRFGFDAASGGARVRLLGTLAHPTDTTGPEVKVDVSAPYARELAPWLGFSSQSEARVALNGTVRVRRHYASLTGASLVVGRTSIAGSVVSQNVAGKAFVTANLIADRVDAPEVRALMTSPTAEQRTSVVEVPILPQELDLADSDVKFRVNRVDGIPLDITDVVFEGRFRGGVMTPSPFSLRLERTQLKGALALDARSNVPTSSLWLAGEDIDVGALLRRLRLAQGIEAHIGSVRLYAQIRERLLGQVLEHSSFVANVGPGTLVFRDANTKEALRIAIDEGTVHADAGGPISASVTGKAGTTPITLEMQGGRLRELLELGQRISFSLTAKTTMAKLVVSGTAPRQRGQDVTLLLALNGERLNGLETLLDTSLPPWGPYALAAQLRATKRGYEVNTMRLKIGESVFDGKGSFETALKPSKLDVALTAERIQLDDFPFGGLVAVREDSWSGRTDEHR